MAGFSQEELAKKIGMHRTTYINKESGKTKLTNNEKVNIVIALKEMLPDLQLSDIFDS